MVTFFDVWLDDELVLPNLILRADLFSMGFPLIHFDRQVVELQLPHDWSQPFHFIWYPVYANLV